MAVRPFSQQLEEWFARDKYKTFEDLTHVFAEKSFAIIFLLLMFVPALPIPTGGITHVFEAIVILLALEMLVGRRTIWLPKRFQRMELGSRMQEKALPFIIRRIKSIEKISRPRLSSLADQQWYLSVAALLIITFTCFAAISPPFSGLDTLPSMGVVCIALALILEDVAVMILGIALGAAGMAITIGFGAVITHFLQTLF